MRAWLRRQRSWPVVERCRRGRGGQITPRRQLGGGSNNSMGLPAGSVCPKPGHDVVAEPSRLAQALDSPSRSSTRNWIRFQPPGSGPRPSGMGWAAPDAVDDVADADSGHRSAPYGQRSTIGIAHHGRPRSSHRQPGGHTQPDTKNHNRGLAKSSIGAGASNRATVADRWTGTPITRIFALSAVVVSIHLVWFGPLRS
jgi:hypothetical protein